MNKKAAIIILIFICSCFAACANKDSEEPKIDPFVGKWQAIEEYQDNELISDKDIGFKLEIERDSTWTLKDDLASQPQTGKLNVKNGQFYFHYDDFQYYLSIDDNQLIITTKYLKGEYPTGKFVFKKVD